MTNAERIDDLLLRWDDLREQDAEPSAEELCRDCPELAAEVARRIAAVRAVCRVPNNSGAGTAVLPGSPAPRAAGPDPTRLGDFEVLELLGSGGMGKVFKARHKTLKRLVALKMILAGAHATPDEAARFRAEAEAVARLAHPNIVQVYEVGEHDSCPFLSLEYLDGGSLEHRLRGQPLPPRQAAELVRTLAAAMHYAHQKGIIHRDLKPANVLFRTEPKGLRTAAKPDPLSPQSSVLSPGEVLSPVISDFGLAKRLDQSLGRTRTGSVLGTPNYMAPEQAEGRLGDVGPATDVYALGAILYECLTGRPPFAAPTLLETLEKVRTEEPAPPRLERPGVPADLQTICLKCLHKEPAGRYASARELAEDLQRFLDGEPIHVRAPGLVERLKLTLNRTRQLPDLGRAVRVIGLLIPCPLLLQLVVFLLAHGRPSYGQAAFLATLCSVPVFVTCYWLFTGEGLRLPLTAATRHLWSIRIGEILGLVGLPLVSWLVHPRGAPWDPLTAFPLWGVLTGVAMFGLGGIYWGRLYVIGLAFIVLAVLMPLRLDLAPLAFGGLTSLTLWTLYRQLKRIAAARVGDEKRLSSSLVKEG
jgi:serine/threonine protein kinase